MKELRDGVALKNVYQSAVQFIQEDTPALLKYFTKNCGFATGIGLRDSTHVLSAKCSRTASKNMTFVVTVGFENVPMVLTESEKKKKSDGARGMKLFTCAVGDTVVVGMKHQNSEAWTTKAKSGASCVAFSIVFVFGTLAPWHLGTIGTIGTNIYFLFFVFFVLLFFCSWFSLSYFFLQFFYKHNNRMEQSLL